jgi:hypothetical protein
LDLIGPIDHATRCGLVFQSVRIARRRALYSLHAFSTVVHDSLDKSWFDAAASTSEQAQFQFDMAQFQRESAKAMQR